MESFYPKFGEVELVLVEDDNDFFDPLESNFEIEDENEDIKLQLNDTIHEENEFNLAIDDDDDDDNENDDNSENERNDQSPSMHCDDEPSDFGRKSKIKQEILEQNCDYAAGAATTGAYKVNKYRPIIIPKSERDADLSDDSMDANDSHFYDHDSRSHEDSFPSETKPNVEELRLQPNKTEVLSTTESMGSIPRRSSKRIETKDATESNTEKKLKKKKKANVDESTAHENGKTNNNKRKTKVKTKPTATATIATAADTATDVIVDADANVDATTSTEDFNDTENKCRKKRPKEEKSVKQSFHPIKYIIAFF